MEANLKEHVVAVKTIRFLSGAFCSVRSQWMVRIITILLAVCERI